MDYNTFKTEIYNTCIALFKEGIGKYNYFVQNGEYDKQLSIIPTREEYTVNSRYLHRGYYCPSPLLDDLVDNTRKGKLHCGATKRKKISHRYLFNAEDKLYLVENYTPNMSNISREFIWGVPNKRFGLFFDYDDVSTLSAISIEIFVNDKLQSYMYASCRISASEGSSYRFKDIHFHFAYYETYMYNEDAIVQWDFSHVMTLKGYEASRLVQHNRYLPIYENGQVVSFEHVKLK